MEKVNPIKGEVETITVLELANSIKHTWEDEACERCKRKVQSFWYEGKIENSRETILPDGDNDIP